MSARRVAFGTQYMPKDDTPAPKFLAHTSGDWFVEKWHRDTVAIGGQCVTLHIDGAPKSEQIANAALIAAAPDLLAALIAMVEKHGPDHSTIQTTAWDRAVAAINKARVQA